MGDREVDAKFGNFDSIVDYSGDDNLGYDETGVDTDLDNQYKRFGMKVEDIDPITGLPKDDSKSKAKKSKKKTPAEEKSSYKVMLDAVKVRRLSDAKAAYSAIKAIGTRYIGLYEALPADYISDDMRTYIDGIKETGPARNEAMSYITSAQRLIHYMEQLGIAARKNNTVPDGIPENLITPEQLSTMILLCENESSLMKKLNGDDVDTKMLSSRRLAMKARSINQNILGLGTAEEPTMPSPSEKNLYIGFAPWESRIFSSGANEVSSNLTDTKKARDENRGDSLSDDRVIHYLGTADSAGATIVVPHQFFTSVCKRIDEDRTVMHKNADDRRAKRSRRLMKESLLTLMQQKPFQDISARDITEEADLNRGTFYLLDGGKKTIKLFGEDIAVNAEILFMPGKSGHADRDGLLEWLEAFETKPAMLFVNHGEDAVTESFAALAGEHLGCRAFAPYSGTCYDLAADAFVETPAGVPVVKKGADTPQAQRKRALYEKLVAAGQRLIAVIRACEGMSNKDVGKFTDQINRLCEKWEK